MFHTYPNILIKLLNKLVMINAYYLISNIFLFNFQTTNVWMIIEDEGEDFVELFVVEYTLSM